MTAKKTSKNLNLGLLALAAIVLLSGAIYFTTNSKADSKGAGTGFDQFGYNNQARVFNGTGTTWCLAKNLASDCMGIYSSDKLVMKWTADWDRGNAENWSKPPYNQAWIDNEWNGNVSGGSGAVWHYKIKWVGSCGADYTKLSDGGYCIWGQFETIMDQGKDPSLGPGHIWFTRAKSAGYGTR